MLSSIMKVFAERLWQLRLKQKLMPKELAYKLGVSDSTICRWERDVMSITDENIVKVAKFFDVSSDYLLGLED